MFSTNDVKEIYRRGDVVCVKLGRDSTMQFADDNRTLIGKVRPCVIVSDERYNTTNYPWVMVAPIATDRSDIEGLNGFDITTISIESTDRKSNILVNQIRPTIINKISKRIGCIVNKDILNRLEIECIKTFLSDSMINKISTELYSKKYHTSKDTPIEVIKKPTIKSDNKLIVNPIKPTIASSSKDDEAHISFKDTIKLNTDGNCQYNLYVANNASDDTYVDNNNMGVDDTKTKRKRRRNKIYSSPKNVKMFFLHEYMVKDVEEVRIKYGFDSAAAVYYARNKFVNEFRLDINKFSKRKKVNK